jgi:CheY-like chemotaxis protein
VLCAENARQALTLLEDHSPDAMLLDLSLPDISGLDLLKDLRRLEQWRRLPVVVFSGSGDTSFLTNGLGVTACLIKSLDSLREIKAALDQAIAGRDLR